MSTLEIHTAAEHLPPPLHDVFAEALEPMLWDPFAEPGDPAESYEPRVDVCELEGQLIIRADVPGVQPEDLDLTLAEGKLVLTGSRKPAEEEKAAHWLSCERSAGEFSRTILLPDDIDPDGCTAELDDGVLRVVLPRTAGWEPVP